MPVTPITTHIQDATARLLTQYSQSPRIVALLQALVTDLPSLEAALYNVIAARQILTPPTGATLDALGALYAVSRNGLDDAAYLALILATLGQDASDGTSDALCRIVQAAFRAASVWHKDGNTPTQTLGPGRAVVAFGVGSPQTPAQAYSIILPILAASLPAGVGLESVTAYAQSGAFCMAGPQPYVRGFADVNGAGGGAFASVLYQNPGL